MICSDCNHFIIRVFQNGQERYEISFCLLIMAPINMKLIECSGYQNKTEMESVIRHLGVIDELGKAEEELSKPKPNAWLTPKRGRTKRDV